MPQQVSTLRRSIFSGPVPEWWPIPLNPWGTTLTAGELNQILTALSPYILSEPMMEALETIFLELPLEEITCMEDVRDVIEGYATGQGYIAWADEIPPTGGGDPPV